MIALVEADIINRATEFRGSAMAMALDVAAFCIFLANFLQDGVKVVSNLINYNWQVLSALDDKVVSFLFSSIAKALVDTKSNLRALARRYNTLDKLSFN